MIRVELSAYPKILPRFCIDLQVVYLFVFRDLERKGKEKQEKMKELKEEEKMKQLKEEELRKAKKTAQKDAKELTKKKSTAETKEVRFHIPVQDSSLYI